jgi:UDP-N-acetylglucosamine 2-epimerase (non-hydrolysing)
MHAIGSRAEAVRLAPVVTALRTSGVPQAVAVPVDASIVAGEVLDSSDVPRTEALVELMRHSNVRRTADALAAAEQTLQEQSPSIVVLGGDADSTLAFALAASKLGLPIARVGAGLRCGDISQSEEINRVMCDRLADMVFTDGYDAADILQAEGIGAERVSHTGNPAIDLLRRCEGPATDQAAWRRFGVPRGGYVLATLRRAENVCDERRIARICAGLAEMARLSPVVLPLHPLTRALMEPGDVERLLASGVLVTEPLRYLDFLSLELGAGAILTDSGSVQDEASALGVRCYTLRRATERVISLTHGTNVLLGDDPSEIAEVRIDEIQTVPAAIPLWDGRSADRIAAALPRRINLDIAS